jgi:TorA maturation chaperone TorD
VFPDQESMNKFKLFAAAFSYPDEKFFDAFPQFKTEQEELVQEYDRLFRASEVWLYMTEYMAKNEFQKSNYLSDIMGFYHAFGVEPDKDRADNLTSAFEFMHYLVFKAFYASQQKQKCRTENALVCIDALRAFFGDYVYLPARKISTAVISKTKHSFYRMMAQELLEFLEQEKELFGGMK